MSWLRNLLALGGLIFAASVAARMAGTLDAMDWDIDAYGPTRVSHNFAAMGVGLLVSLVCVWRWQSLREIGPTDDADRDEALRDAKLAENADSGAPGGSGRPIF